MGCCPKWPCWLSKDLLGISKGKLVYCGEVSVCLHQQFVVYFPHALAFRQELKELQTFRDQLSTLLDDAKGQSCSMPIRLACCTLLCSSVQIFFIKVPSKAEPQKEILSEKKPLQTVCDVQSCWLCALIEQLRPSVVSDILEIFWSPLLPRFTVVLACCTTIHPSIKKGQPLCKKEEAIDELYCYSTRDDRATKIGFHILGGETIDSSTLTYMFDCHIKKKVKWLHLCIELYIWKVSVSLIGFTVKLKSPQTQNKELL